MAAKITARKYGGDDAYSWAVFIEGQSRPFVTGLSRSEVSYYKKQAEKIAAHRAHGQVARGDCTVCVERGYLES